MQAEGGVEKLTRIDLDMLMDTTVYVNGEPESFLEMRRCFLLGWEADLSNTRLWKRGFLGTS